MNYRRGLTALLLTAALLLLGGCAAEQTPYEINDGEDYTVSVKYDANGGTFTTNTSVIVDSYNLSEVRTNADGKAEIALLPPDAAERGNDAFTAVNNGYFLAGWYAERSETTDAAGNPAYTYGEKWDFATDLLTLDPAKTYTSAQPVLTLYAAWVPLFTVDFYDLDTGDYLSTYTFNPTEQDALSVPAWDMETGAIEMFDFPQRSGYTFRQAYYDAAGADAVTSETVKHPGIVNETTGTAENPAMRLYLAWDEGEWYHIYNVEQFLDNASVSGCYVLHADLDFADAIWPSSLMYGNFSGTIQGNGHTLRNITAEQTNNSKVNAGLFGYLTEDAVLTDLTLENVTFTIKAGTRVAGASYGVFAGTVSAGATLSGVRITGGTLQIDSSCYFGAEDYVIGLVCGMGSTDIDSADITCVPVGDAPERVRITVNEQEVTVEFVTE